MRHVEKALVKPKESNPNTDFDSFIRKNPTIISWQTIGRETTVLYKVQNQTFIGIYNKTMQEIVKQLQNQ